MEELARRINDFFERCPKEARAFFSAKHVYQHEMKDKRDQLIAQGEIPESMIKSVAQDVPVAALFAAIMQTPNEGGYHLHPIYKPLPDPESPSGAILLMQGVQVLKRGDIPPSPFAGPTQPSN